MRPVRNSEEPSRAGKNVEKEVGRQPKGVHVDVVLVGQGGERVDLIGTGELHLVDHEYLDLALE